MSKLLPDDVLTRWQLPKNRPTTVRHLPDPCTAWKLLETTLQLQLKKRVDNKIEYQTRQQGLAYEAARSLKSH